MPGVTTWMYPVNPRLRTAVACQRAVSARAPTYQSTQVVICGAVRAAVPGLKPGNGLRGMLAGRLAPFWALTSNAQYFPPCG